jgi:glycosyltransferase involved in cell wall biosynthesis
MDVGEPRMNHDELLKSYEELLTKYQVVKNERDILGNSLAIRIRNRLQKVPVFGLILRLLHQLTQASAAQWGDRAKLIRGSDLTVERLLAGNLVACPRFPDAHQGDKLGTPGAKKAILVSHDAYRAGAQLIALGLLREFVENLEIEFFVIFRRSEGAKSALVKDFSQYGHTICNNAEIQLSDSSQLIRLLSLFHDPQPIFAIANSADSLEFIPQLRKAEIPVVALVHEYLDIIQHTTHLPPEQVYRSIFSANKVVFPSEFVRSVACSATQSSAGKNIAVIPQGLINPKFGLGDRVQARRIVFTRHRIPEESILILGCGSIDARKGTDLFLMLAARMLAQEAGKHLYFLWLGGENEYSGEVSHWINRAVKVMPRADHFVLAGRHTAVEDYFLAANVFALTSREDPFPCVVHEAMASRLPVVTFASNGGAVEALDGGCGIVVPYLDVGSMADAILELISDPAKARSIVDLAQIKVRSHYDFHVYFTKILQVVREMTSSMPFAVDLEPRTTHE